LKTRLLFCLLVLTFGFGIKKTNAAICVWTGGAFGAGSWNSTSSWQGGNIPTINDDVQIADGVGWTFSPTIPFGYNAVCNSLTIGNNASITLTFFGNLTISTFLTCGNNNVTFAQGLAGLTGPSTMAVGTVMNLGANTYTFDVTTNVTGNATLVTSCTITSDPPAFTNAPITIGGNITSAANVTISTYSTFNVNGTLTVTASTFTLKNSSQITFGNLITAGYTLSINCPLAVTNAFTITAGGTISMTGNNLAVITAGTFNEASSGTISLQATFTVSGAATFSATGAIAFTNTAATKFNSMNLSMTTNISGYALAFVTALTVTNAITETSGWTMVTNTKTTTAGSLGITAGTLQIGSSTTATTITVTNASTSSAGTSLTLYNGSLNTGTLVLSGSLNPYGTNTITSSGTSNSIAQGISFGSISPGYTMTFLGGGNTNVSSTSVFVGGNTVVNGSATDQPTLTFNAGANITATANSGGGITNYGTLNFSGTSSSGVNLTASAPTTVITNKSGATMTANYFTWVMNGDNAQINNAGTFTATNLTMNPNHVGASATNLAGITNSGVCNITNFTFTVSTGNTPQQYCGLSNSNLFTVSGTSLLNLNGFDNGINNTGIFNAGPSGSTCTINLAGTSQGGFVTNTGSPAQKAYFNLGPTSSINILGNTTTYVTNGTTNSIFTLMSDATGSASLGQITSSGTPTNGFVGKFNVQRYITGGSVSTNRGYRLLSSPVNLTSQYNSGTSPTVESNTNTFGLDSLNKTMKIYATNYSTPSFYPGAFTAGPGGTGSGFSIANTNPIIYIFKETLDNKNATFIDGKNLGINKITATNVTLSDATTVTLPVGNGYLLYFTGPNTRTSGSPSVPTTDATITHEGFINQGQLTVNLWYTPQNGSSTGTAGHLSFTSPAPVAGAGYNLVGNPYASTINLSTLLSHNSGVDNVYLLQRDISTNQHYLAYTPAGTSAPFLGLAASGEGFLVHTPGGNNTLTFLESDKYTQQITGSSSTLAALPKGANNSLITPVGNPLTGFYMKLEKDSATYDYCGVYFRNDWSGKYENGDAYDLNSATNVVYLSSLSTDNLPVSVNHMPAYTNGVRTKLNVIAASDGIYDLKMEDIRNIDTATYRIYLIDHYKKDSLDIGHYGKYAFNIVKADTTTYGQNRFEIAFERIVPLSPYRLLSFFGQKAGSSVIQLNWKTVNEGNFTTFGLEKLGTNGQYTPIDSVQSNSLGTYNFNDRNPVTGNNIYRLAQNDIHGKVTFAGPINITFNSNTANGLFTIYPNPSKDLINVAVNSSVTGSQPSPVYLASIYNLSGTVMDNRQVNANNWTQDITSYKAGVYILELKTTDGNVVGKAKFVKTN